MLTSPEYSRWRAAATAGGVARGLALREGTEVTELTDDQQLARRIREYWFANAVGDPAGIRKRMAFWFGDDPDRDAAMARRWGEAVERARTGGLDAMARAPGGRLALILLLDQLPRNLYRGTPASFASDGRARYWVRDGMSRQVDLSLAALERCFFYLPLEHSESLDDQELSVARYRQLLEDVGTEHRAALQPFLDHARGHRDVVARFGRFPHRNAVLGRPSTAEEQAYLDAGAPRFGVRPR